MFIFGQDKPQSIAISVKGDTRLCFPLSDIPKLAHNAHEQKIISLELFKNENIFNLLKN